MIECYAKYLDANCDGVDLRIGYEVATKRGMIRVGQRIFYVNNLDLANKLFVAMNQMVHRIVMTPPDPPEVNFFESATIKDGSGDMLEVRMNNRDDLVILNTPCDIYLNGDGVDELIEHLKNARKQLDFVAGVEDHVD